MSFGCQFCRGGYFLRAMVH